MNTSFNQGELLFPHPYRLQVSVGKDFQLLLKMSPCLLDTPIVVNTWQKEPQNNYCKLPPSVDFFFSGMNRSSGLKWQENVSFLIPCPAKYSITTVFDNHYCTNELNYTLRWSGNLSRKYESFPRGLVRGQCCAVAAAWH